MTTKEKERAKAHEAEMIRQGMIYLFTQTNKDWNGETPYPANECSKKVAESEKFRKIYFNFIRRIK